MMEAGAGAHPRTQQGRPSLGRIATVLVVAALLGSGVGIGLHFILARGAPASVAATVAAPALHGEATWAAGARPAPPITTLRDQTGGRFSLAALHGKTVAIVFFDSYCTQACPLEGRALAAAEDSLPASRRPVLVVVSVNPHDTPASARAAARKWGLAPLASWHWLMGTHAQLARVWSAYHIFVAAPRNGDISHTPALYVLDRGGYERSAYLYPFAPRFVTGDLAALAGERKGGRMD